ncbi:MAG: patatin-like phospholipase family protein [Flavobacteriaceae bacterium]|nr:patatin-like phospholipase family protein [Flavobacteriaceae bacterium]
MKKAFLFFVLLSFLFKAQVKENLNIPENPKIGLSLSGGGAKGFAHIGVLKILDSLGVRIDYISGTSMGAIVGGLYASGYSGKDIEKIMNDTDFYSLLDNQKQRKEISFFDKNVDKYILSFPIQKKKITLPSSISSGQKAIYTLKELFKNVANIEDFSQFPIPFMCVATNLETGDLKIFEQGDLVKSIIASSAFPSLIDPVKIGNETYIDGAMTINYPSKPLKDKGIDIVIGVNLSTGLSDKTQIDNIVDILNQIVDFGIQKETKNQLKYTDINIHPNLQGMKVTSFDQKKEILTIGHKEALKYVEILDQLPKKKEEDLIKFPLNPIFSNLYKIDSLVVKNNFIYNEDYIQGKMGLKIPSIQTYENINKMIKKLYATNNFSIINYDISYENHKNILTLYTTESDNQYVAKIGLHYDKIFRTGLLLNLTLKRLIFNNSTISLDLVIGDSPRYYFNYFIDNGFIPSFGVYTSGMSFNLFNHKNVNLERWLWYRNEAFIQSTWRDKYAIGVGISHDYFKLDNYIHRTQQKQNYINPYAYIKADTQDDKDFPMKGFTINVEGKYIDLLKKDPYTSFQIKANTAFNFPINSWVSNRLEIFGGISTEAPPLFYQYHLGGIFGQNLGNFFNFQGYLLGEHKSNDVIGLSNSISIKLNKHYYIIPNFSIANAFNSFENLNLMKNLHSNVGLTLGYKSPFGQLKVNYSTSLKRNSRGIFNIILGHWF